MDHRYFFTKNPPKSWWADLWDFPRIELENKISLGEALKQLPRRNVKECNHIHHTVTHNKLHIVPLLHSNTKPKNTDGTWYSREEFEKLPMSSLAKKILTSVEHLP